MPSLWPFSIISCFWRNMQRNVYALIWISWFMILPAVFQVFLIRTVSGLLKKLLKQSLGGKKVLCVVGNIISWLYYVNSSRTMFAIVFALSNSKSSQEMNFMLLSCSCCELSPRKTGVGNFNLRLLLRVWNNSTIKPRRIIYLKFCIFPLICVLPSWHFKLQHTSLEDCICWS